MGKAIENKTVISEDAFNKLMDVIKNPPKPTKELEELMANRKLKDKENKGE